MQVELLYSAVVLSHRQGLLGSIRKPRNHQQASVCCMRICSSSRKHSGVCQQKILNNIKREVSLHIYTSLMDVCVYMYTVCTKKCAYFKVSCTNFFNPEYTESDNIPVKLFVHSDWWFLALPCTLDSIPSLLSAS